LEEESIPSDLRPMMGLIRSSGEVLRRVLDDVLDFSKIDSGRLELEEAPFDLKACLNWSFELFRQAASENRLEYRLRFDQRLPERVSGDATRLRQVTANLMSNAVKFTPRGSIEMAVELVELAPVDGRHRIRVSVRDTGIGIPEDRIDRLFQSFSQVDPSTSRCYGGTGLGLAISQRLVEMMGGEIQVESHVGQGSVFAFTFSAGIAGAEVFATGILRAGNPKGLRILVAEDNRVNQLVAVRLLQRMGCQADVACDGTSAIQSVAANSYDIVLMDLHMPEVDGMEATRRIRRLPTAKSCVPIVALTASASQEVRTACLAAGMNDHLAKPIELDALRRVVDRWGHGRAVAMTPAPKPATAMTTMPAMTLDRDSAVDQAVGQTVNQAVKPVTPGAAAIAEPLALAGPMR
jgi:CheY-like chemotaxis protein/anti-sigma regulatory factor (Ser/Thr protein kinase)